MFSPELENLIKATLADGVLEEYEKAALVKRAQAEGVDMTELEIYINSILQTRQQEKNDKLNTLAAQRDKEKKAAFGRVCPSCGKPVPPMTLKCECGFEFSGTNTASGVKVLFEKIDKINSEPITNEKNFFHDPEGKKARSRQEKRQSKQIEDLITMFPVPNTKEDIVEFLTLAVSLAKPKKGLWGTILGRLEIVTPIIIVLSLIFAAVSNGNFGENFMGFLFLGAIITYFIVWHVDTATLKYNKRASVWKNKFDQIVLKGRSMRGDSDFQKQLDYYEGMLNAAN